MNDITDLDKSIRTSCSYLVLVVSCMVYDVSYCWLFLFKTLDCYIMVYVTYKMGSRASFYLQGFLPSGLLLALNCWLSIGWFSWYWMLLSSYWWSYQVTVLPLVVRLTDIPGDNRLPEVSLLMTAGIILLELQTIGRPAEASGDQNSVLRKQKIWSAVQHYRET